MRNWGHPGIGVIALAGTAWCTPITLVTPNGGKVQIQVTYSDGSTALTTAGVDNGALDENPEAGKFTFTPPNQSNVRSIQLKNLGAIAPQAAAIGIFDFGPGGPDVFVPFYLPEFSATDTATILLTQVDVPTFSGTISPYQTGDPVTVTGGAVPGLPGVTVRNASSQYTFSSFFDVFVELDVGSLPLYSGTAENLDPVQGLPEPGAFWLVGLGIAGVLWRLRRLHLTSK